MTTIQNIPMTQPQLAGKEYEPMTEIELLTKIERYLHLLFYVVPLLLWLILSLLIAKL